MIADIANRIVRGGGVSFGKSRSQTQRIVIVILSGPLYTETRYLNSGRHRPGGDNMSVQVMIAILDRNLASMRVAVFQSERAAERWREDLEALGYAVTQHAREVQ